MDYGAMSAINCNVKDKLVCAQYVALIIARFFATYTQFRQ